MSRKVNAGDAQITVSLDGTEKAFRALQAKLAGLGRGINSVGLGMIAGGGAIVGIFAAAANAFATNVDELDKMQARTGVNARALSALGFAAEQSGSSIETVERGFIALSKTMAAAEEGTKTKTDALARLGLAYEQLKGLAPEDQFELLADRVSQVGDPTQRAAVAMEIFGKAGQKLLPLFAGGAAGIRALTDEAEQLGITIGAEDVAAAAALNDAMNRVYKQINKLWTIIGAAVAGPLANLYDWTTQYIGMAIKWVDENRGLVLTFAQVATAVVGIGGALVGLGVGLQGLAFVAGGIASAFGAIAAVLGLLLSPIGLVTAAIGGAAVYFLGFTDAGRTMVGDAVGFFGELGAIADQTFGGIRSALAAGDLEAAGRILWAGLAVVWEQGTAPLRATWRAATSFVVNTWHAAVTEAAKWFNWLTGSIERGWLISTDMLIGAADSVWTTLKIGMNELLAFFERTWARIKGLFGGDATKEIARINKELEASNAVIRDDRQGRKSTREADRAKALEESRRRQADTSGILDSDLEAKFAANQRQADEALTAAQERLAAAKAELSAATQKQQEEAAEGAKAAAEKAKAGAAVAQGAAFKAGDAGSGVFNARAIASLLRTGKDAAADRTAEATERTAEAVEKVATLRPLVMRG